MSPAAMCSLKLATMSRYVSSSMLASPSAAVEPAAASNGSVGAALTFAARSSSAPPLRGHPLERPDRPVVASPRGGPHQDEPLPPVIEHDGAVDDEQGERRDRRLAGVRGRMAVEQRRGLVADAPHQ